MADEESRIIDLLEYQHKCIKSLDDKWISEWATLIEKYFKHETRNPIRLKAIALLSQIFSKYHIICEDDLMNKIILPNFNDVDQENDSVVRKPIVHLLFDIASACLSYKHCNAILAIVKKVLNKPFKQKSEETNGLVYIIGNADIIDSRLIISNFNKLFNTKLHRVPIDPAVNMLDISVNYLNLTYKCPLQDPTPAEIPMIRRELFSLFLKLRCNKYGHLGILTNVPSNHIHHNQQHTTGSVASTIQQSMLISAPTSAPPSTLTTQLQPTPLNNQHQESCRNININNNDIKYSPFIICVKRQTQKFLSDNHSTASSTTIPPQSSIPTPDSPTIANYNPFSQFTNVLLSHPQPPILSQQQQQHQHQQHHSIFVPNATLPNCPLVSRCINLDGMFSGIIECINQETDTDVLKLVLDSLPSLLSNKPLVLTTTEDKLNQLCISLSELTRNSKTCRQNSRIDIVKCGLRCLTTLLIYRKLLDHKSIKMMLAAFEDSLKVSSHQQPIVPLFTTCLIELQESSEMTRFLPVVLNRLSKFSPTLNLGISILEFLSYLILFPKLYENFSEDEYKFIFAIALPYTNPFRYNDYITCLAFRVLAMWYLNCRPSLRCAFVELVKKSLQSNVIQPFKEINLTSSSSNTIPTIYSQSSNLIAQTSPITYSCPIQMSPVDQRKRSSSLNTENSFKPHQGSIGITNQQLNEELIETFADLLSRYTHGQCLAIAPKNKCNEIFVDRASSQTWLHGNSLVTITSGRSSHGWAEILIRRPTGNTIWIGRLQNTLGTLPMCLNQQVYLDSLNFGNDVISLFSAMTFTDCGANNDSNQRTESNSLTSMSASSINQSTQSLSTLTSLVGVNTAGVPNPGTTNPGVISDGSSGIGASNNSSVIGSIYHNPSPRLNGPIPLPKDKKFDVALSNFDHITPYETHKIGIVYVARNQADNRAAILANKCGSPRYYEFLSNIGTCIILNDIDPEVYFIGGLDAKGEDGKYAYFWKDNVTQVIFHVATFMPLRESDPQCNNKNRHIGNDHICIVYNDSRQLFQLSTIKGTGQFLTACIVITPLEENTNLVEVEVLPDLKNIVGDIEPKVLSSAGASLYARQMAIHLNLASKIHERRQCEGFFHKEPYVSNWVERLRCIKRIRQRLDEYRKMASGMNNSVPIK